MKSPFLFLLIFFASYSAISQVVFLETFDEADDATTGTDNTAGAVGWTATCPGSLDAGDYFKVLGGTLEAQDTNDPAAVWTTGNINITPCAGLEITMDISEEGAMEDCSECVGTGLTCIDWVKVEYNLDGTGWTEMVGTSCPAAMTSAPGEMIATGDIGVDDATAISTLSYTSECIGAGTTLAFRISCMCWAAAERWIFDNIQVACNDCVLPVEIIDFNGFFLENEAHLTWSSLNERDNDYFQIERSFDGIHYSPVGTVKGSGTTSSKHNYSFLDLVEAPYIHYYYRIRQFDFNGSAKTIDPIYLTKKGPEIFFNNNEIHVQLNSEKDVFISIYDLSGKLIYTGEHKESANIPWPHKGLFIIELNDLNLRYKLNTNE